MSKFRVSMIEENMEDGIDVIVKKTEIGGDYKIGVFSSETEDIVGTISETEPGWSNLYKSLIDSEKSKLNKKGADYFIDLEVNPVFVWSLGGTATKYPSKMNFYKNIEEGKTKVTVKMEADLLIAYYEDEPVGQVDKPSDMSTLVSCLDGKNEIEVTVTKKGKTPSSIQITYSASTKTEAVETKIEEVLSSKTAYKPKDAEAILRVLSQYKINNTLIMKVMNRWRTYSEKWMSRIPKQPNVLFIDDYENMESFIISATTGSGIMLLGPASSGKNTAITTLAWLLQVPLIDVSITEEHGKDDLTGSNVLAPEEVKGTVVPTIKFKADDMIEAIEEGCMVNLDEFNLGRSEVLMQLNGFMDFRGQAYISGYKTVERHPDTIFTATGNIGSAYVGVKDSNMAFKSRYNIYNLEPIKDISPLLKKLSNNINHVKVLSKVYKTFMNSFVNEDENADEALIIPRCYENAIIQMDLGVNGLKAIEIAVINQCSSDHIRNVALEVVRQTIGN